MGTMSLPPGFRFHPTDDELVGYYLKRKVDGQNIELEVIPVIDLYKFDPWELPEKSFLPKRDMEWFFFCPRDKKYPNGTRTNRATSSGYWKATGKDRKIFSESSVQGLRKTLVFYRGRAPGGQRTDWVMHEYRLCEDLSHAIPNFVGAFALCRVVKRNENVQKIGDSQGECKGKRSFSSATNDFVPRKNFIKVLSSSEENSSQGTSLFEINSDSTPINSASESGRRAENQPSLIDINGTGNPGSEYLIDAAEVLSMEDSILLESILPTQFPNSIEGCPSRISPVSSYASFTDDTYLVDELINGHECFASFPSPLHCMSMYCNEENMSLQDIEWEMARSVNPPINGVEACSAILSPLICRQASDTDEASLWQYEYGLLEVM